MCFVFTLALCLFCRSLTCFSKLYVETSGGSDTVCCHYLYLIDVFLHYSVRACKPWRCLLRRERHILTDALISGVEKLCERSGGSFCLDGFSCLLILSQLTQHTCSYTLDVLDGRIQQLHKDRRPCQLHRNWLQLF